MTGFIIFLAILLFFFLIGMLKGSFIIEYEDNFALTLKILFIKIPLVPGKEKKINLKKYSRKSLAKQAKKQKQKDEKKFQKKIEKKRQQKAEKIAMEKSGEKKKKMTFSEVTELISMIYKAVTQLFSHLFGYIRTEVVKMHISLAGGSVDKTATMYGACMGGINLLFELLDKKSHLKLTSKDSVCILPDYVGSGFKASVKIIISIRVWQIFGMIIPSGITALKYFIKKIMREKETETINEQKEKNDNKNVASA